MSPITTTRHSIRTRVLAVLGVMGVVSVALLAMIEFTAFTTHRHTERVSETIFPATLELRQADSSFEQLQRRYKDAVLLEDPAALSEADHEADTTATALLNSLASTLSADAPDLALRASEISDQFSSIRPRSRETYGALVSSRDNVNPSLQAGVTALAADNNRLAASMKQLGGAHSTRRDARSSASPRSGPAGRAPRVGLGLCSRSSALAPFGGYSTCRSSRLWTAWAAA